jgi:erythrin-vacuolar iron transport family protein
LFDVYCRKAGDYLPLIRRRQDVRGFVTHKPLWLVPPLGLNEVRKYAANMEYETVRFYRKAAPLAGDISVRKLLEELAEAEDKHENLAEALGELGPKRTRRPAACSRCSMFSPGYWV